MKGLQAKDLRGQEPAELQSSIAKLREELFKNQLKKNTNQLENTAVLRKARRDIAKISTVLHEKLRAGAKGTPKAESPAESKEG